MTGVEYLLEKLETKNQLVKPGMTLHNPNSTPPNFQREAKRKSALAKSWKEKEGTWP